jgi:Histidine kinase-like ATPase domain
MVHTAQPGHVAHGSAADIAVGGACAWLLPADGGCASVARSLLRAAMVVLRLGDELTDAAVLAVSELATNAYDHGLRAGPGAPELWLWARVTPMPQLVVTVFDTCRSAWPETRPRDPLDEQGRGLGIVGAVADAWGAHLSRSRRCAEARQQPGKAVWAAFPLPGPWPAANLTAPPADSACTLTAALTARGVENTGHRDGERVSLVCVPLPGGGAVNVWIDAARLTFTDLDGHRVHRLAGDLHDVAEHLVRRTEERRA